MNTRNRISKVGESGVVAAVVELNQCCDALENVLNEVRDKPKLHGLVRNTIKSVHKACDIIENTVTDLNRKAEPVVPNAGMISVPRALPISEREQDYLDKDGKVIPGMLNTIAHQVGPWECGDSNCAKCPFGGDKGVEAQRRECLSFYLVNRARSIVADELVAGIPYSKDQLTELHLRELNVLAVALGVSKYKLRDRTKDNLVRVVLSSQENYLLKEA
jgi:hypothetical protein